MSAASVADDKRTMDHKDWDRYEQERYDKKRVEALRLADQLTDEFYRSAAIHSIINLCMKADDVDDARTLYRHVTVDIIREKIAEDYPELSGQKLSDLIGRR